MNKHGKALADIILLLHLVIVLFLFVSPFIAIIFSIAKIYIILGDVLIVLIWITKGSCPFTTQEIKMRKIYDPKGVYEGACITHYLNKFLGTNLSNTLITRVVYAYMISAIVLLLFV